MLPWKTNMIENDTNMVLKRVRGYWWWRLLEHLWRSSVFLNTKSIPQKLPQWPQGCKKWSHSAPKVTPKPKVAKFTLTGAPKWLKCIKNYSSKKQLFGHMLKQLFVIFFHKMWIGFKIGAEMWIGFKIGAESWLICWTCYQKMLSHVAIVAQNVKKNATTVHRPGSDTPWARPG